MISSIFICLLFTWLENSPRVWEKYPTCGRKAFPRRRMLLFSKYHFVIQCFLLFGLLQYFVANDSMLDLAWRQGWEHWTAEEESCLCLFSETYHRRSLNVKSDLQYIQFSMKDTVFLHSTWCNLDSFYYLSSERLLNQ